MSQSSSKCIIEFTAFGVPVRLTSDVELEDLKKKLPDTLPNMSFEPVQAELELHVEEQDSGRYLLYKNGELEPSEEKKRSVLVDYLLMHIRIAVGERAPDHVFIHAGAIGWNGTGIIFPAKSGKGKSTLTAEFVRQGADYYSDEYAVIGRDGLLFPFAKKIELRVDGNEQREFDLSHFSGTAGAEPIPIGLVMLTEFDADAEWKPEELTVGASVLEVLEHTLSIRHDPKFTLSVLSNAFSRARLMTARRGEAEQAVRNILELAACGSN